MRKFILIISILSSISLSAQEYEFSQYFKASLFLNPAFSGIYNEPHVSANFKVRSFEVEEYAEEFSQFSVVFPINIQGTEKKQIGGFGLTGYNQRKGLEGIESISGVLATYAQTLKLALVSPDILSVGIQAGFETISITPGRLDFGSQYSPFLGDGYDETVPSPVLQYDSRTSHMLVNAGVMYFYNRERNYLLYNYSAFSGVSVTNANRPDKGVLRMGEYIAPMRFKYHGAFEFNMGRVFIIPTALVQYEARDYQVNLGSYFTFMTSQARSFSLDQRGLELVAGLWYRLGDRFILIGGINHDSYSINLSYDLNSTVLGLSEELRDWIQPAFEISLTYSANRNGRIRKVSNPLF